MRRWCTGSVRKSWATKDFFSVKIGWKATSLPCNTRQMTLHTKTLLSRGRTGNTFHDTEKNKNENTEKWSADSDSVWQPSRVAKPSQNPDDLLEHLNSHHPTIVFTVEENPDHFLDTVLSLMLTSLTAKSKRNQENYQRIGNQKSLPNGKEIVLLARSTESNAFLLILTTMPKQLKQLF